MVFIGKSIDRLVNSIDSYIWLLEIWSIFPFDRIMLGIINIFDSIGIFRKLYPILIPEISSPRSKNFAKERKKLMALRMSETTSSWEWFQLEGNNDAVDRVRGICCARRLPPNFGGPRSIMDISIFHILRSSVSLERASRKRERKRGSEGDRRKLEWFSNRFPFQVRTPTTTRRQGLSNSQPPGLSFRKLSFQMFANRLWTRATATFIPVYLSLRRIEIDRARSPIVFNSGSS